jgi:hypothetical protein
MEHMSIHNTFSNFKITGARLRLNADWNQRVPGDAAAHFTTIKNGLIDSTGWPLGGGTGWRESR